MSTTEKARTTATRTTYHILKRTSGSQDTVGAPDAFELVYQALEATSAAAAIRYFATGKPDGKHTNAIEGSYIAIPSRSFVEKTVKVETTTTVKLT
jgi:hypothetical protein